MLDTRVNPADLQPGAACTVWALTREGRLGHGQGGKFVSLVGRVITIDAPLGRYSYDLDDGHGHEVWHEVPWPAEECLEYGEDCSGPVDLHWSGGDRSWPRCEHHAAERDRRRENSIERYADSDVIPDWFDPAYAGERWDEDY